MVQQLGYNDGILLVSLLYSCVDLQYEWDMFNTCRRPIHQWLLVSYACVIGFRLMHLLGMQTVATAANHAAGSVAGDFLLDLRQKKSLPRFLASFTWFVALPFFLIWTLIGTSWMLDVMRETPKCVPSATHLWFSGFWLALCYVWIIIHAALGVVAWVLESRVRRAEGNLREIEDPDVISRWGQVSQLSGYQQLQGSTHSGLTPAEIRALPCETTMVLDDEVELGECHECPICIHTLESGDNVRRLPVCNHTFHRSCIDLWLLRRADCPLCKRSVRGDTERARTV